MRNAILIIFLYGIYVFVKRIYNYFTRQKEILREASEKWDNVVVEDKEIDWIRIRKHSKLLDEINKFDNKNRKNIIDIYKLKYETDGVQKVVYCIRSSNNYKTRFYDEWVYSPTV